LQLLALSSPARTRKKYKNVVIALGQNTRPISLVVAGQCKRLALVRRHGQFKNLQDKTLLTKFIEYQIGGETASHLGNHVSFVV
jgi:hypothetical protein